MSMVVAPAGVSDFGPQNYHLTSGTLDRDERGCQPDCLFSTRLVAHGDHVGFVATSRHKAAAAREARALRRRRLDVRLMRQLEPLIRR
jgi:hypothetical protein